jgi:hypothetical protein
MLDNYKDRQKVYLSNYDDYFQSKIQTTFEKSINVRDDKITNPTLKYVKNRMKETQIQHDKEMREGIVIRGSIMVGIILLRMVLTVAICYNWCMKCCKCRNKKQDGDDDSMVSYITKLIVSLQEFRKGGNTV